MVIQWTDLDVKHVHAKKLNVMLVYNCNNNY